MLGFLLGAACAIGVVRMLVWRRRWRRAGAFGHGACGGRWMHRRGGAYTLLEDLETTPGQEKVLRGAFSDLRAAASEARGDVKAARAAFARAIRGEHLDDAALAEVTSALDAAIERLRRTASGAIARVHETLDAEQRARLASWLEAGPRFGGFRGGPYRGPWPG